MSRNLSGTTVDLLRWLATIANHDFCPWANRYFAWLRQPIGWFIVGIAATALTALFLEPRMWVVVVSLVSVMVLGVVWPWLALRGLTAEIDFNCRRCRESEPVQVRLEIHNRWPFPVWGLAIKNGFFMTNDDAAGRPVAALARVAGWSYSVFPFDFQPDVRGVYPYRVPELATGFPFGLWQASRRIVIRRELVVWPRTTPLTSIASVGGDIADVIGMLFNRPGDEGDLLGVRPFRQGDRLRHIHWAHTARRDALIVTERQAAARRLVVVAVDVAAFSSSATLEQDLPGRHLNAAIRVAVSIAREFHAHHAEVRFVMDNVDVRLTTDLAGLHRMLDALARFQVEPASVRPPTGFERQALAVVVTSSQRAAECAELARRAGDLLRLVLVDEGRTSRSGIPAAPPRSQTVWGTINSDLDVSPQLQHQWERACHDSLPT